MQTLQRLTANTLNWHVTAMTVGKNTAFLHKKCGLPKKYFYLYSTVPDANIPHIK